MTNKNEHVESTTNEEQLDKVETPTETGLTESTTETPTETIEGEQEVTLLGDTKIETLVDENPVPKENKPEITIEKRKRVAVIGKNLLSEQYERAANILFGDNTTYLLREEGDPTYRKMVLDHRRTGIIWFQDVDYTNVLDNIEQFKTLDQVKIFEGKLKDLSDGSVVKVHDQLVALNNELHFRMGQAYVVIPVNDITNERERVAELIEYFATNLNFLTRIQLELNPDIPEAEAAQKIGYLNTIGLKNNVKINAVNYKLFHTKNSLVGNEPNISGFIMEEMLGGKMTKVIHPYLPSEHCHDHRHVDMVGNGEPFDETKHRVRGGANKPKKTKKPKATKAKATKTKDTDTNTGELKLDKPKRKKTTGTKKKVAPKKKKDPLADVEL